MNRCKFVASMFAPYCSCIKIKRDFVVGPSLSNFNRRTLCGSCETARRYAAAGCTYKVGNLSRYITSFIRRPSPRCCFITWPPISEKLLVSTNKQYIQEDKNMSAIQTMFTFDPQTRVHTGSRPAQVVGGKPLMQSAYATATPPPETIPEGHVARWTGTAWETVEDHRQHMDSKGTKTGGTPYWMPAEGDDHTSPPRYMETPGPLPAGAVTERPAKSPSELLTDTKAAKRTEIKRGYDAALAASLTMPAAMPTSQDVAVGAALFAVDDAEGLAFIQERHAARRDELLAAVDAADSVEAVQAVDVSYDV